MNLGHFWIPPIENSTDEQNNDCIMNWPYFCNEISSKSTVTHSYKKCHHYLWIWDISEDPLYGKQLMKMTMIVLWTDHFVMKYHQNQQLPTSHKKCHHCLWICHISEDPLYGTQLVKMIMIVLKINHTLKWNIIIINSNQLAYKSVTTAPKFGTFPKTPYRELNWWTW